MPQSLLPARLMQGRVHEAFGPAARGFGLIQAVRQSDGPVLWISPAKQPGVVMPDGLAGILPPARLILAQTTQETDSLATAEEALKDGIIPFVVIQTTTPLNLREGRRLQLAARAGGTTGLCLIAKGRGSNAAETRWHCTPVYDATTLDSTLMRWEIIKNKTGTLRVWHVRWNRQTHRLDVVSPVPLGPGAAGAAG